MDLVFGLGVQAGGRLVEDHQVAPVPESRRAVACRSGSVAILADGRAPTT
ncbi:hypothetical protein [Streptomyces sp. 8N706]